MGTTSTSAGATPTASPATATAGKARPLARRAWRAASAIERLSLDDPAALGRDLVALIDAEAKLKSALGRITLALVRGAPPGRGATALATPAALPPAER